MPKRKCRPSCSDDQKSTETVQFRDGTIHLRSVCAVCKRVQYLPKQWGKETGHDLSTPDHILKPTKAKWIAEANLKQSNTEVAKAFLTNHHIGWHEFSGSHWRIGEVDFWPSSHKSYQRITHQRGKGLSEMLNLVQSHAVIQTKPSKNWDKFFNETKPQKVNAGFNNLAGLGRKYDLRKRKK